MELRPLSSSLGKLVYLLPLQESPPKAEGVRSPPCVRQTPFEICTDGTGILPGGSNSRKTITFNAVHCCAEECYIVVIIARAYPNELAIVATLPNAQMQRLPDVL